MKYTAVIAIGLLMSAEARSAVRITEWMYQGNNGTGEFIELTNLGGPAVDMTGWSFDDDSRTPGSFSLSGFGTLQPNESAIITEVLADTFRTNWNLSASVKVLGGSTQNLGRNDEINIYDAGNALVDRLTFGDQNIPGTIRTNDVSGWATAANLGTNNVATWTYSGVGDAQHSYTSAQGEVGSPGIYVVPEPAAIALLGVAAVLARRRRAL